MKFEIITIFPKIFDSYFGESILKRAQERGLIKIKVHNLRDFTKGKHRKVDDKPYGGGAGMVLMAEPILAAVNKIKKTKDKKTKVIIFSAKGKRFTQKTAYELSKKYRRLILISGRYEGIDERVKAALRADEISIGSFVLTDGDVAAMAVVSAVSRLLPGVIKMESLEEESFWNSLRKKEEKAEGESVEYPHYTRPETIEYGGKKYRVPKVLISGDHKKIEEWRRREIRNER